MTAKMTSCRLLAGMLLAAGLLPLPRLVSAADEPEAAAEKRSPRLRRTKRRPQSRPRLA